VSPTATVTPGANATNVRRNANVTAKFSEQVAGATGANFTLKKGTAVVTASVSYSARTRVATLNPTKTLSAGTIYTVSLGSGVKDSAGNGLKPMSWSFKTGKSS
jgi:hypothetical protein